MPQTVGVVIALAVLGAPLALLTAAGAGRRGNRAPLVAVSALFFPVTWAVWYLRDERPFCEEGPRDPGQARHAR